MTVKYLDEIEIQNKRVLIRVDYNVPYDKELKITDETRITATLDTINYCLKNDAKIILISHLGRPKGKLNTKMSLKPVAERLSEILKHDIRFIETPPGEETIELTKSMNSGEIILLENIRFYPGEEKNDMDFGETLSKHGDVYVNDAFATAHRAHSSNWAVTQFMDKVAAGFLLKNEIEFSQKTLLNAEKPFGAIIGGAKVSSKLDALYNIIDRVDFMIIGGGMAFTFLRAMDVEIGKSLLEEELIDEAKTIMDKAKKKNVEILLPLDVVCSEEFDNESETTICDIDSIRENFIGLDIGPKSIKLFKSKISNAKTIIWNGPMGAFEMSNFASGTNEIAHSLAKADCLSIVGGGDSVTAINQAGVHDDIGYISTGGGAFLELLEGKELPGITALDKDKK